MVVEINGTAREIDLFFVEEKLADAGVYCGTVTMTPGIVTEGAEFSAANNGADENGNPACIEVPLARMGPGGVATILRPAKWNGKSIVAA